MTTITVRVLPDGHRYHRLVAFLRRDLYDFSTQPNDGKPLVSGSVPKFDADGFKRWMSGWVEPKHIPTIAAYVEKMLGGNDR